MKNTRTMIFRGAVPLLLMLACDASAQPGMTPSTAVQQSTSNYYFARPNELTIVVDVIGFVQRPGRYEISNKVSLVNLLALAGGGNADATLDDVTITRVLETGTGTRLRVLHLNLEDLSKIEPADLVLQGGDVVQVPQRSWVSFRDAFQIVVGLAVITTAVAQVIYASYATQHH